MPGSPLICTADKSKSCRDSSAARRGRVSKMTAEVQTSFARGGAKSSAEARHKRAPRCFTHRGPPVSRRREPTYSAFDRFPNGMAALTRLGLGRHSSSNAGRPAPLSARSFRAKSARLQASADWFYRAYLIAAAAFDPTAAVERAAIAVVRLCIGWLIARQVQSAPPRHSKKVAS